MGLGVDKVTIIGAGVMGRSIAQKMATEGLSVELVDVDQEILDRALEQIKKAENSR